VSWSWFGAGTSRAQPSYIQSLASEASPHLLYREIPIAVSDKPTKRPSGYCQVKPDSSASESLWPRSKVKVRSRSSGVGPSNSIWYSGTGTLPLRAQPLRAMKSTWASLSVLTVV